MKHRVFAYVEDNAKRGRPSAILGLDEEGKREFCAEVEDGGTDYMEELVEGRSDSPAAVAFAAFERFCKEECGLKDRNDEVIIAERRKIPPKTLADYVGFRLGAADWATVTYIATGYRFETVHVKEPLRFLEFIVLAGQGMPEPYATRRIYQRYRKLIHKDRYTAEELDRMEEYIFSHLGNVYRRSRGRSDAIWHITFPLAAIYRGDQNRFTRILESIIADYPKRRSPKKRWCMREMLENVADLIYCEGEIDLALIDEEEKKPPLERKAYAMFTSLSLQSLSLVRALIEGPEEGE